MALDRALADCVWLTLTRSRAGQPEFPDVSDIFPAANRMQRAAFDLLGVRASDAEDNRQWLRHAAWPAHEFPLRKGFDAAATYPSEVDRYPFVQVTRRRRARDPGRARCTRAPSSRATSASRS